MNVSELVFNKLEDENTPDTLRCNMCNKIGGYGFLACDIKIAVDATFMLVLCSKDCEFNFRNHKFVNKYLRDRINAMRKLHRSQAIKRMGR